MSDINFKNLVPHLTVLLTQHHSLYSGKCKSENWEELCSKALILSGLGSDWKPNANHNVGKDQMTNCGLRISNKSGKLNKENTILEISGSRLTSHKTLEEKLKFLSHKHEDFILCLASKDEDWNIGKKIYYFIIIDSKNLNYEEAIWEDMISTRSKNIGKITGHKCKGVGFSAKILNTMSHQIWTKIESSLYKEFYELVIG